MIVSSVMNFKVSIQILKHFFKTNHYPRRTWTTKDLLGRRSPVVHEVHYNIARLRDLNEWKDRLEGHGTHTNGYDTSRILEECQLLSSVEMNIRTGLSLGWKLIQERITRYNRTLGNECRSIGPAGVFLEETKINPTKKKVDKVCRRAWKIPCQC